MQASVASQHGGNGQWLFDEESGAYRPEVFGHLVEREVKRALRYHEFLVILALDVGKYLRRLPGPSAILRLVADHVRGEVRATDIVGRLGESLGVALLCVTMEDARLVAERLQARVTAVAPPTEGLPATQAAISIGGACFPTKGTDARALLNASLDALRRAAAEPGGGVWIEA